MKDTASVIISGGSRGLGLALSKKFLELGFNVGTFARNSSSDTDSLKLLYPNNYFFLGIDITDSIATQNFVDVFCEKYGKVDYLINNAAIGQDSLFAHTSNEEISKILQVNISGTLHLTKNVLKKMAVSASGSVLFLSSICATKGYPGLSVYAGTKGFLDSFCQSLVVEYRGTGIKFNSVAPGFFESEMSASLSQNQLLQIMKNTPSGRLTHDAEIVRIAEFLFTSDFNFNGARIVIDGGVSA
jgi:3-oxoacyl-[acyl-carrier protein] reductase